MCFRRKQKKEEKMQKMYKKQIEEQRKVDAEICFKKWKLQKTRQQRQEKRIKRYQQLKEQEEIMLLRERKKMFNQVGDVMLAYSLNKNIRELERVRQRPKSARMGIRA